jgi:hypothetical protein
MTPQERADKSAAHRAHRLTGHRILADQVFFGVLALSDDDFDAVAERLRAHYRDTPRLARSITRANK